MYMPLSQLFKGESTTLGGVSTLNENLKSLHPSLPSPPAYSSSTPTSLCLHHIIKIPIYNYLIVQLTFYLMQNVSKV